MVLDDIIIANMFSDSIQRRWADSCWPECVGWIDSPLFRAQSTHSSINTAHVLNYLTYEYCQYHALFMIVARWMSLFMIWTCHTSLLSVFLMFVIDSEHDVGCCCQHQWVQLSIRACCVDWCCLYSLLCDSYRLRIPYVIINTAVLPLLHTSLPCFSITMNIHCTHHSLKWSAQQMPVDTNSIGMVWMCVGDGEDLEHDYMGVCHNW